MKQLLIILFILSQLPAGIRAQALPKKDALQAGIKSVSEWETNMVERKAKPLLETLTRYDVAGNLVEITERDNTGVVTLHESYEFNADGQKIGEIQYQPDGKVKKKHVYKYANGLRSERFTYDKNGTLISQKKYVYEFQNK